MDFLAYAHFDRIASGSGMLPKKSGGAMSKSFEDQGGFASMNPPSVLRWLTSKLMTRWIRPNATARRRARAERTRRKSGNPHRVEYFHQVDDGYSHLAAQLLQPLLERYDVELIAHLVTVEADRNLPKPDLLLPLSRPHATYGPTASGKGQLV